MIGQRLKVVRNAAGLSLRELAKRISNRVTAQAIGKYERDESMPSSGVLIAIAKALGVSVDYLLSRHTFELEALEFRKKAVATRREEVQLEAEVIDRLDRYLTVEELLRAESLEWVPPRGAPYPVREPADGELAAERLRDVWGLGRDPIPTPGLAEYLEERGVKVLSAVLDDVHGSACWVRGPGNRRLPVIVMNERDTGERQRFTLAHEIGHIVMEVAGDEKTAERAAHRFSGAFLMPAAMLWAEVGRHRSSLSFGELFALKRLFGVSVQAIVYRCKDLGIIDQTALQRYFKKFGQLGWRRPPYPEPAPLPREEPRRFRRLCYRALAEGAISEAQAAEMLRISVQDLNNEMDELPVPQ